MEFSLDRFYQLNRRILIWIALFGLIWLLRDYFALIFLTFILAFVAVSLTGLGQRYLRLPRAVGVVLVYVLFVTALVSFIKFVTPAVFRETLTLQETLPQIRTRVLDLKQRLTDKYPQLNPLLTGYAQRLLDLKPLNGIDAPGADTEPPPPAVPTPFGPPYPAASAATSATPLTDDAPTRFEAARASQAAADAKVARAFVDYVIHLTQEQAPRLVARLWDMVGTLLLALLFSFLITLDITRLTAEIQNLRASRLHDFYEQTAQPVVRFCYVLGRAFQAQAVIACANTFLTFIGLLIIGVPSVAMLSVIVFFCSFVPVLGVFISTTPIVLVAINAGGLSMGIGVIVLIVVVHAVEAYMLNPLIYGAHLKINPVLVLIILFVGHRAFGVWGMLLAVPATHYLLHDVFGVHVWKGEAKGGIVPRSPVDKAGGPTPG